ncbi:hypothetical protein BCV70DRAFT_204240 [Testicularia cyperi]|uniref:Uncharacterized protein n=1 Tax=Testicularia cyperi TaxID=1882483 RepID=A0A317XYW8_9BASI|nr:hypothetical protein BCV70DRAFT_204240 [Testicularia cyperi]
MSIGISLLLLVDNRSEDWEASEAPRPWLVPKSYKVLVCDDLHDTGSCTVALLLGGCDLARLGCVEPPCTPAQPRPHVCTASTPCVQSPRSKKRSLEFLCRVAWLRSGIVSCVVDVRNPPSSISQLGRISVVHALSYYQVGSAPHHLAAVFEHNYWIYGDAKVRSGSLKRGR